MDVFGADCFEKQATAFDEPVDKMPNPRLSSYRPSPNTMDYQNNGGSSFLRVTPGAIVGSAVGLALGRNKGKKELNQKMQEEVNKFNNSKPVIEGNYYQQAQHVMDNLGVVFTPFGAVYTLRNKNKNVAIDTIETGEMNRMMKDAWEQKDGDYFKNLMLTKMYSEMQIAEQGFTRRMLEMSNPNKTASELEYEISEMSDMQVLERCAELRDVIPMNDHENNDFIESITDYAEKTADVQFDLKLDRPFEKYAGAFGGIKASLGFGESKETLKSMQKNMMNEKHLKKNLKVGFMPDRVVFFVDDVLISTLPLTKMNEDGYSRFLKQDTAYFKDLFNQETKKNIQSTKVAFVESDHLEKTAQAIEVSNDIKDCFVKSDTHPVTLFLAVTKKLGSEWFTYDPVALVKILEDEFELTEPICDSSLDKILSIQVANSSELAYKSTHAFEKIIRAFNNKPIDFLEKEDSDLDVDDFAFAIDVLNRVTPFDDIYDNFSPEVIDYISAVLARKDCKCYCPSHIVGSPLEPTFQEIINESLLRTVNKFTTDETVDITFDEEIQKKNSYIHDISLAMIKAVRRALKDTNSDVPAVVNKMSEKLGVPEDLKIMVKSEVLKNLAVDELLKLKEISLVDQMNRYNLNIGGDKLDG